MVLVTDIIQRKVIEIFIADLKCLKISCHVKELNLFHTGLGLLDLGSSSQQVELFPQSMVCTGRRPGSTGC
jgi:hypothetical protein